MQGMNDSEDAALWYALYRREISYWFEVDFNAGCNAHEFYVDDGLFAVGDNLFQGQDRIRAFYVWRQQRGHTTTRHLINNLQVARNAERRAQLTGVLSLYCADGRPPFHGERPPMLVADLHADCVLGEDNTWRYQSHVVKPIFVGSDIPLSISIDTQILAESEGGELRKQS